ncbi:MAG: hypothetical protein DRN06_01985 [Thermoprotei archaeon]|nr:MAG: hypothetical protein DRN06_01985 [Thermoprotei archaeon]
MNEIKITSQFMLIFSTRNRERVSLLTCSLPSAAGLSEVITMPELSKQAAKSHDRSIYKVPLYKGLRSLTRPGSREM